MGKVFVSHSHADNRIVATFVWDLWDAGVDVWVDLQDINHGDFLERIDDALEICEWFVLVMTPASLASPAVQTETRAAIRRVWNRQMRDIIPIVGKPIEEQQIPATWGNYHRHSAVQDGYTAAFQGVLRAIGKAVLTPLSIRELGHDVKGIPEASEAIVQAVKLRNQSQTGSGPNPVSSAPISGTFVSAARQQAQSVHAAVSSGQWRVAITYAEAAVQQPENQQDATLWGEYAVALIQLGERKKGLEMVTKAVQMDGNRTDLLLVKAQTLADEKQREEEQRTEAERIARMLPNTLQVKGFTVQVNNGVEIIIPPMRDIPKGSFLMGSKKDDTQAYDQEKPQDTVMVGAYEIGTYPLTVAEYVCFVRATKHSEPRNWQAQLQKLDHPVVNISWNDMLAYTQWLAQVTGEGYRLPTEAEWEKAARGIDGRIYPWGNKWDASKANTSEGGKGGTTPVGSYPQGASPYGCLDMNGNVWERTSSLFVSYPYKYDVSHEDLNSANSRVLRGGSWNNNAGYARVAYRDDFEFGSSFNVIGVRVVRGGVAG